MYYCDSFEFDGPLLQHVYFNLLTVVGIISPFLFIYISFCIIHLSPKMMKTYRWLLLAHHISAELVSFYLYTASRIVLFAPIPSIGITGFLRHFMSPQYTLPGGLLLESLNIATIVQLFAYRYWAVARISPFVRKLNNFHKLIVFGVYCGSIPLLLLPIYVDYRNPNVTQELIKNYTCVQELTVFPVGIHGYDTKMLVEYFFFPLLFSIAFIFSAFTYFVWINLRAIKVSSESLQLRKLQRNFIIQLIYQLAIPLVILFFPVVYVFLVVYEATGRNTLMVMAALSIATFSIIDSIILIAMNKAYRTWITNIFRKYLNSHKPNVSVVLRLQGNPR